MCYVYSYGLVATTLGLQVEGLSTLHLRTLAPKAIPGKDFATGALNGEYMDPLADSKKTAPIWRK